MRPDLYLLTLAATLLLMLGLFGAALYGLSRTGHLPPPALSNRLCADEKLRFFRDNPPGKLDLLVIGSSVAWRHFDGATFAAARRGHTSLNGGVCGLNLRQTESLAEWLLDNLPPVRSLLLILAPPDAEDCEGEPADIFDVRDATRYTFRRAWPGLLYLRYFDPVSFARNVLSIKAQEGNKVPLDPLVFTPTGDGPLDTNVTRGTLLYDAPKQYDAACFTALHDLATRMANRGLHFAVVMTPLSPVWKAEADPDGRSRQLLAQGVQHALDATGATFWNADFGYALPAEAFTDAIHMRWSAVPEFTRQILAHAGI